LKTAYADIAEEIAAPAQARLDRQKRRSLGLTTSHQGGETYKLKNLELTRLTRFLILGTETGSFYQSSKELTRENSTVAQKLLDNPETGPAAVAEIVRVSHEGLAEKQDATLFCLALATRSSNLATRQAAYQAIVPVCRTLSQLCTFLNFRFALGGVDGGKLVGKKIKNARDKDGKPIDERYGNHASSDGLRRALRRWLNAQIDENLAYQIIKYPQREGITFRDILRLAKPVADSPIRGELYGYAVKGELHDLSANPEIWRRLDAVRKVGIDGVRPDQVAEMIREYDLPREVVRTEMLNDPVVWEALLQNMPVMAMVRNLGKMTSIGLFKDSQNKKLVVDRLHDEQRITKSRIHPLALFAAQNTYQSGHGLKGNLSWNADSKIVDALGDAFDLSFKNVTPSGKRILLAIDTSGSMRGYANSSSMSSASALSAVMALVILRSEDNVDVIGVDTSIQRNLGLSGKMRPIDAANQIAKYGGGGTYLELPFDYARQNGPYDAIMLFTDSENGGMGLRKAQEQFVSGGEHRRIILAQMVANSYGWTKADNQDWNTVGRKSLEIVGFDPSIGKLTSDFLAERF
jgi:60 kDa SS-A/Ro ribonucleoprotein